MSRSHCCGSLRRLGVVLGLALMALVFAPGASGAAQLDMVTVTGSGGAYMNINIRAQSGTSGQNPTGTASFTQFGLIHFPTPSGPVTCVSVTGSDQGGGTVASPTTAVLNFQDQVFLVDQIFTVELVDNGGNGLDTMISGAVGRAPTDCSLPFSNGAPSILYDGRAVVFDAPVLPTSKDQCKHGGWRNFPQFKNQGQCIAFVNHQARQACLAERATIGRPAFRAKYGQGPHHRNALSRCISRTAGG
jgi:hypothetical protein